MPELADAWIGRTIGGCRVHGVIGRGGMGTVYLASQDRLAAWVALKVIRHGTGPQEAAVGRFEREAKAIAALRGKTPHVVQVYDYGWDSEAAGYYITMEFVDGESLEEIRRRMGRLPTTVAVAVAIQAARALATAHELELVHRDIKPDNLLLNTSGIVKVADFGLVRRVDGSDGMTATGQALGTATFMAPEQAMGDHVDHRADLYSLGATLFALITGHPPHDVGGGGPALFEALMHLATTPPPELEIEGDPVDPALNTICKRLLAKRPEERFASATEVAEALEGWLKSQPGGGGGDGTAPSLAGLARPRDIPKQIPPAPADPFADTREQRPGTPAPAHSAPIDLLAPTGAGGADGTPGGRSAATVVAVLLALGGPAALAIWAAADGELPAGPGSASHTAAPPSTTPTPPTGPATAAVPSGPSKSEQITANLEKVAKLMDEGDLETAKAVLQATYQIDPHDARLDAVREHLNQKEAEAERTAQLQLEYDAYMLKARPAAKEASSAKDWSNVLGLVTEAAAKAPDAAAKEEAVELRQLAEDHLTWIRAQELDDDGERAKALDAANAAFEGREAPAELQAMREKLAKALERWAKAEREAPEAVNDEALAALWDAAAADAPTPADAESAKERAKAARSREKARTEFRDALAAKSVAPKKGWTVDELRRRIEACEALAAALQEQEQEDARNQLQPLRRLVALHVALDRAEGFIKDGQGADARAVLEPFLVKEFAEHARALQLWKRAMDIERSMIIDLGDGVKLVMIRVHGPKMDERYWMGSTEVTQGQWMRLEPKNPSTFGVKFKGAEIRPVENLTFDEAKEWCKKLNGALSPLQRRFWRAELPTQRRWQHAARGGIPASNDKRGLGGKPPGTFAWFAGNSALKPCPVAELTPNTWGLYDVFGNVWELCSDRTTSPTGEPARVTCGGSFLSTANQVGANDLSFLREGKRARTTGFRVMLSER